MSDKKQGKLSVHPYIGGSASNLIRNVIKHGGVSRDKLATFTLTLCGTALTLPLRLVETLRFNKAIERSRLQEDPIFILGHWRSGTTHLHNVISQDKRLGYLTTLQAIFPTCAVILSRHKLLKRMVASLLPAQRMMDNMKIGVDLPQEEEFSLSCLMTTSHHCNHFPRTIRESFDKYVLFQTSPDEVANWEKVYQQVIKKASFLANGKRLVLKNPYNTARIPTLLKLYPNAKFIHISRNPYNIYVSALHDFVKEAEEMALQEFTNEDFSELCYSLYGKIMNAYWDARDLVPPATCRGELRGLRRRPAQRSQAHLPDPRPAARACRAQGHRGLPGIDRRLQEEQIHLQRAAGPGHRGQLGLCPGKNEIQPAARHRRR